MSRYVDSTEQLVMELFVRNINRSKEFYQKLGFKILEDEGTFARLAWEGHHLMLDGKKDLPPLTSDAEDIRSTMRILVPNVDDYWKLVGEMGAPIVTPLAERFGLRDFTFVDPDGFGLRFATKL
jgi:catechol 2,3-dioxygenase-like lactoylglutathione lyase family enzyme